LAETSALRTWRLSTVWTMASVPGPGPPSPSNDLPPQEDPRTLSSFAGGMMRPPGGPVRHVIIEGEDEVAQRACTGCIRCVRDRGGGGSLDPLLVRLGGVRGTRWSYVGPGRGSYDKGQSYNFVGAGAGAFEKEIISGSSSWRLRKPCCVLLLLPLIPLLAYLLLTATERDEVVTVSKQTAIRTMQTSTMAPAFGCLEGETWSDAEEEWCCKRPGRHCTSTGAPRPTTAAPQLTVSDSEEFNCSLGLAQWQFSWPMKKKEFCCVRRQVGCLSDGSGTLKPTPARFNCHDGFPNEWETWKEEKKAWCCLHQHVGCITTAPRSTSTAATAPPTTTLPAPDCEAGEVATWPEAKRSWCCKDGRRDCSILYDCLQAFFNWKVAWTDEKKHWCCKHEERGCPSADEELRGVFKRLRSMPSRSDEPAG